MSERKWVEYVPAWAPHVRGRDQEGARDEDGAPLESRVEMHCATCDTEFKITCVSGQMRTHVARFAVSHAHRDSLKDPLPRVS